MRRVKQCEARRRRSMTAPALTPHQMDAYLTATRLLQGGVDVDGYGQYKPVPPPKPLQQQQVLVHQPPPPYRMPPIPSADQQDLIIPGSTMGDQQLQQLTPGLQTHSSKFPIEREVILTSGAEKSSATFKARLLPEFRGPVGANGSTSTRLQPVHSPRGQHRAAPAAIAPDAPARHLAWTPDSTPKHRVSVDAEQLILTRVHAETSFTTEDDITHHHQQQQQPQQRSGIYKAHAIHEMPRGHNQLAVDPHGVYVRSPYMPGGPENPYMFTTHTGAVPRNWPRAGEETNVLYSSAITPRSRPPPQAPPQVNGHAESRAPAPAPRGQDIEPPPHRPPPPPTSTDQQEESKPVPGPKNFPAKTYHTIKDMLSTRFGGKGTANENENGMNNARLTQLRASGKSLKSEGEIIHQQSQQTPVQQQQQQQLSTPQHQFQHRHPPPPTQPTTSRSSMYQDHLAGQPSPDEGGFTHSSYNRPAAEGKSEAEGEYYYARPAADPSMYVALRYQQQQQHQQQQQMQQKSPEPEPRTRTLSPSSRELGDGGGRVSGGSSDYEKATHSSGSAAHTTDSGRGPSLPPQQRLDTSTESSDLSPSQNINSPTNDSEWVDIVESELRQILDPRILLHNGDGPPPAAAPRHGATSTLSESVGSMTPPLPPLSPSGSPCASPKLRHYKLQGNSGGQSSGVKSKTGTTGGKTPNSRSNGPSLSASAQRGGWSSSRSKGQAPTPSDKQLRGLSSSKKDSGKGKMVLSALHTFGPPDSAADMTSTTTGLDLDSVLDGQTENTSDDEEDDDLSTTVDATDAQAIRRQLEGLENMYSEVLKMLGVKKYGVGARYLPASGGTSARRRYGSLSSLPSSVSSRPVRERRGRGDDRKRVKDIKGINKRFQRLESHVVTLARSVAHLSSEMRTQHLMIQEMENIRGEIAQLRASQGPRSHSVPRLASGRNIHDHTANVINGPQNTRIKKLTKFFGDEPPLLRLFLRKLGYEKYANNFEQEKVGLMELPYLTEERLQKMGIPMGPRLRILQEAQTAALFGEGYSVYVV